MSPAAAMLLVEEIYPILEKTIPRKVKPLGSEDHRELVQDAVANAAMMLDAAERNGKALPPANSVAYYSIQRSKSGRRSYGDFKSDVLSPAFQLENEGRVFSLDLCLNEDSMTDESFSLHDLLADKRDDASELCMKKLDWDAFLKKQPKSTRQIIKAVANGEKGQDIAKKYSVSPARISQIKREIAGALKEFMGNDVLQESVKESIWERDLRCLRGKNEWKHLHLDDDDEQNLSVKAFESLPELV